MNTSLSINQIECAIIKHPDFDIRKNLVVCNVSWGLLNHEADMLVMSKAGYLTEIEIKRSLSDLKADFKKKHDHSHKLIKKFYYAVPESLLEECKDLIMEHKQWASGIITYDEECKIKLHSVNCHPSVCLRGWNARKLF